MMQWLRISAVNMITPEWKDMILICSIQSSFTWLIDDVDYLFWNDLDVCISLVVGSYRPKLKV